MPHIGTKLDLTLTEMAKDFRICPQAAAKLKLKTTASIKPYVNKFKS